MLQQQSSILASKLAGRNTTAASGLLVSQQGMEVYDEVLLLLREGAPLEVWPQVVYPPQPAALATPLKS
jgi:hypothetical protein